MGSLSKTSAIRLRVYTRKVDVYVIRDSDQRTASVRIVCVPGTPGLVTGAATRAGVAAWPGVREGTVSAVDALAEAAANGAARACSGGGALDGNDGGDAVDCNAGGNDDDDGTALADGRLVLLRAPVPATGFASVSPRATPAAP